MIFFLQGLLPSQDLDLTQESLEAMSHVCSEYDQGFTQVLGYIPHLLAYNIDEITG